MYEHLGSPPGAGDEDFTDLLMQLASHLARQFCERLALLGLEPHHTRLLIRLAVNEGLPQQAFGEPIGLYPTQMVRLIDELAQRGLVERRSNATDRRSYALHLTAAGRDTLRQVLAARTIHRDHVGVSLAPAERAQLTCLLRRLATEQGITGQQCAGNPAVTTPMQARPQPGGEPAPLHRHPPPTGQSAEGTWIAGLPGRRHDEPPGSHHSGDM